MIQKQGADSPDVAAVIARTALRNDARNRSGVARLLGGGWQPDQLVAELARAEEADNPRAYAAAVVRDLPDEPDPVPVLEQPPADVDELVERAVAVYTRTTGSQPSEQLAAAVRGFVDRESGRYGWPELVEEVLEQVQRGAEHDAARSSRFVEPRGRVADRVMKIDIEHP